MTSLVFRLLTSYQLFCPIVPKFFYFRGDYIEQFDNHDYSWHGKLMAIDSHFICEDSFTYGIITVLQRDSAVFGEIVIDTIGYQIRDLTGGLSALIALDITEFDLDCGMVSDTAGIQQPGDLDSRGSYAGQAVCPVRVGVLYTEGIGPVLPDYDRIAELGIFNTNQILRNSQLLEYSLRFVLAGVELLPSNRWEQSANLNFDRTDIATNSFVLSQRQIMNADIMIVLTRVYPNGFGAVADFGDEPADVDNAFALVAFKYMGNPRYSFSHEIFHLFGARHDGSNACWVPDVFEPPPVPYAYGYNWYTGSNFFGTRRYYKTIMAICPPTLRQRLLHLSNPDVKVGRKASGVENAHDNARRTVEFGCTVANYINSSEVVVAINGPKEGCPGDLLGVYGIVQGEPPPHSYTWRTTADGTTWSNPVTSSQPDFYVQLPDTPGDDIFIELVAGPLQGQMKKAFKTVYAKTDVSDCKLIATSTSAPRDPDLIVYPNPSTGVITVDSEFLKLIERITVVDLSGRVLIDKEINTNENRITLNLIHLEPGLYMVSAFTYELAIVKPIILHR